MKITANENKLVYIQKFDADFILKLDEVFGNVPKCVLDEIHSDDNKDVMDRTDDYACYAFLVFRESESKYWIMTLISIVDYDSYIRMPYKALFVLSESIEESANRIYWVCNKLDEGNRVRLSDDFQYTHALLWQEAKSINILMNTRKKGVKFPFPEDYKGAQ